MRKININEAKTTLASLVKEVANGEEVIITEESGLAIQLVLLEEAPGLPGFDEGTLFNPEGLWEHAKPITSEEIDEARNETWRKFDQAEKA
ncbi:MAG: type II toxin-antitoxin system Phd/YefM family antitoxin [Gemmatimonadota bacterium]|nr:type II toxin-antitoxin system Phd/YefM family antitoxin [Gemmatimonadota bacterium]